MLADHCRRRLNGGHLWSSLSWAVQPTRGRQPAFSGRARAPFGDAAGWMVADWQTTVDALSSIGAAVAYVGFSMGMNFGAPTVASMASIKAAVFGVGGIPTGSGIEDPPLRAMLLDVASRLYTA